MDQSNFQPNSKCFSSLIEVMILNSDVSGVNDILSHMESNGINPSLRSLRRLAIHYAKVNNEEKMNEVKLKIISIIFFFTNFNSFIYLLDIRKT